MERKGKAKERKEKDGKDGRIPPPLKK